MRRFSTSLSLACVLACASFVQCTNRGTGSAPAAPAEETLGRFVWQDLVTDDVASSRRFYEALLGWEFEETSRLGDPYWLVRANGQLVAGMTTARRGGDEPIAQWLSYLRVEDVAREVSEAEQAGGEVLVRPLTLGESAYAAVVTDVLGAPLGLVSFPDSVPIVPESSPLQPFLWRDYLAPDGDVDEALAFYRTAQDFEVERLDSPGPAHYLLTHPSARSPVGGLVAVGRASVRPSWLPFVRVQDPAALARRAAELGGEVLLEPSSETRNGSLAIVADPSGAALALQKWPVTD